MKELDAYILVHVISIHESNKDIYNIKGSELYHMHDEVEDAPIGINCHLDKETWDSISEWYQKYITVTNTSIELRNLSKLKKYLDIQMMYFKDDKFYDIVWEKWQNIRNK